MCLISSVSWDGEERCESTLQAQVGLCLGLHRYVTEGCFRVSHRAEGDPQGDLRAAATLPGVR